MDDIILRDKADMIGGVGMEDLDQSSVGTIDLGDRLQEGGLSTPARSDDR